VLTTADSNKIGAAPVTDQNANIAIPSERARFISPDLAILMNASVVARPLMTPEVCSIKVKDLTYQYRWVNRDGQGGQIYQQRKSQGFLNATTSDVEILGGDAERRDGEIRAGDLILMKIRKELYEGAMKYNMQRAIALQGARGVFKEGGSTDVMSDAVAETKTIAETPGAVSHKAEPFIPKNVDALLNDSERSGRAEQARKTNAELGKKA
jgi:hypothetical protein